MSNYNILQSPRSKKIILISIEIVFLIISLSIFNNLLSYQVLTKIYIKDMPPEIPAHYKDSIYEALAKNVLKNTESVIQMKNNIAVVRKDTTVIQYNDDVERYDGSFIVDLDEIQQSYLVKVFWPKAGGVLNDEPISVQCPDKRDVIYDNFQCGNTQVQQLISLLPTEVPIQSSLLERVRQNYPEPDIDPSFVTIRLYEADTYSNKNKTLEYNVVACGDENIISESRTIVQDWITSLGFNPDDYKLNFVDGCEDN